MHLAGGPDVALLARTAEDAGVDLRIILLTRNSSQTLASTTRRGFHKYSKTSAELSPIATNAYVMIESARSLQRQLAQLDPAFYACISYDTAVHGLSLIHI